MNTYKKVAPNVFAAACDSQHEKGAIIELTTKRGKVNEHIVHNYLGQDRSGKHLYSITRADGFNLQQRALKKADQFRSWAGSAENKSDDYYNRSKKDHEFLRMGEPIKVGHHSERRHRKIIEQAQNNADKSVELMKKADSHESKADHWESKADEINLSIPESLEYYSAQLEKAIEYHEGLKSGKIPKEHSYSVPYANKKVKDLRQKVKLAKQLWG